MKKITKTKKEVKVVKEKKAKVQKFEFNTGNFDKRDASKIADCLQQGAFSHIQAELMSGVEPTKESMNTFKMGFLAGMLMAGYPKQDFLTADKEVAKRVTRM